MTTNDQTCDERNARPPCTRCNRFYRTYSAAGGYLYWCRDCPRILRVEQVNENSDQGPVDVTEAR